MRTSTPLMREPAGVLFHGAAITYAVLACLIGLLGILHAAWWVNAASVLLLAHGMIIAAYLVHECAHNTVFRRQRDNARLGATMTWFCGAAYGTYEDIRYKHFRHHVDNDDVAWFDYERFFERHPVATRLVQALEFIYVPAHEVLMHGVMAFTSFVIPERRNQRARNLAVLGIRFALFVALAVYSPRAALLYVAACLIVLHVLRFMDMLQHDYPYTLTLYKSPLAPHRGDSEWEQAHTFSNPLSLRFPRLNWLVLNFGYHNAHHSNMHLPWYRLPALHRELTADDPARVIPLRSQLGLYHRNRVRRVYNPQCPDYPKGERYLQVARSGAGPIGGNAASFLTSF